MFNLKEIIEFLHQIKGLKKLPRYGNNDLVKNKDTVGSHSWRGALICLLISSFLEESGVDSSKVIKMIILHDLVELGNQKVKALGYRDESEKRLSEEKISLFGGFVGDWTKSIKDFLEEFLEQKTVEARVAKMIDNYESNLHVIEEVIPIKDPTHRKLTEEYIKRREGILPILDCLIKLQSEEIEKLKGS